MLIEEFKGEFECLGENTEKYITFSVPLKKEDDIGKIITYKLKFIDSYRFMLTSLSTLVDNLSGVYEKEYKRCTERKKMGLNCEFIGCKNGRLNYKCKEYKISHTKLTNLGQKSKKLKNQKIWESIMICMFNVIHSYFLMCLKTLEISVLKYINLILFVFCVRQD